MKFSEFMIGIKKSPLKHIYLLAGEEHYYSEKAWQAILKKLFPQEDYGDAVQKRSGNIELEDLIEAINSVPFLSEYNVILLQDTALFKADKSRKAEKSRNADRSLEELLAVLADMPEYTYLIFMTGDKPDKRKKLYKAVTKYGAVLEAEPVKPWNIDEWLTVRLQELHCRFDREAALYFHQLVGVMQPLSLEFLDQQLSKLALLPDKKDDRLQLIDKGPLVKLFAGLPEVSIFALLDAISDQDAGKAMMILRRQLTEGTYFTVLIALLTRHVRQLWQAQRLYRRGIRGKALGKPMGLNPFIAGKLGEASTRFSQQVLHDSLLGLIDADYMLKNGQAGNEVLENIVLQLCQRRPSDWSPR